MTTPAVVLTNRASRVLWRWCVVYTAVTPRGIRDRRRAEIRSHLWESEHAGLARRSVVSAGARGVVADLTWTVGRGLVGLGRSLSTPTPYVVLAALMPIAAWIGSALTPDRTAHYFEAGGGFGGPVFLLAAALAWWIGRPRRPSA